MKGIPNLFCGIFAVGGNYNLTRDIIIEVLPDHVIARTQGEWVQGVWNKGAEVKYTELKEHLDSPIQMLGISLIAFTAYQSTT